MRLEKFQDACGVRAASRAYHPAPIRGLEGQSRPCGGNAGVGKTYLHAHGHATLPHTRAGAQAGGLAGCERIRAARDLRHALAPTLGNSRARGGVGVARLEGAHPHTFSLLFLLLSDLPLLCACVLLDLCVRVGFRSTRARTRVSRGQGRPYKLGRRGLEARALRRRAGQPGVCIRERPHMVSLDRARVGFAPVGGGRQLAYRHVVVGALWLHVLLPSWAPGPLACAHCYALTGCIACMSVWSRSFVSLCLSLRL